MTEKSAFDLITSLACKPTENGCWIWPNGLNRSGHPILSVDGDGVLAHRTAYRLWRKAGYQLQGPLRQNVVLLQSCGNRLCVNPLHMEPVDPRSGSTAPDPRGRHNRVKTHCPQGHALSGNNLRIRSSGRRRCQACHREELRRLRKRRREETRAEQEALRIHPLHWLEELPDVEPVELELPEVGVIRIA